ncbi:hypothetical protein FGIG_01965 [Fasciola gigantica]|uniref:UPF0506 domain-containing protein n=1 Tax=Fasciola gigantica TaxID=46835 RepID=A0A504YM91_FASGI|nr:hypothetical protein FGIG_01965 [Fasciola gigantica]
MISVSHLYINSVQTLESEIIFLRTTDLCKSYSEKMNGVALYLTTVVLVIAFHQPAVQGSCVGLGESCSRTVFKPCCGTSVCRLEAPFRGKCVPCFNSGRACLKDSECCSGDCSYFRCV